ncbi:hypothetical protein GCM10023340_41410 [Nocardioides marinquilinus]|uniref:Transglycosylase SLT domain-containing protein n=1 Tax=Nocardioides marinquilinus TaxID=1210400 RepID=A0ABP9Q6T5_9ACTN
MVPLALVSAAWTAHLSGAGAPAAPATAAPQPAPSATPQAPGVLPGGTDVPALRVDAPASLSTATDRAPAAGDGTFAPVAARTSAVDIPSPALAAYQRAESVINAADPTCGLRWQLVAAIGRVESNHGRFAGSVIAENGTVSPAIYGPRLDGRPGTSLIRDTDGGQYDGDARFDRAVGPMQFIPSTWAVVGVDADNDGVRDPQDVDDAALAAAVYLCSGDDDLGTEAGMRPAVLRYNHSNSYVTTVLGVMQGYLDGDYGTSPEPVLNARTTIDPVDYPARLVPKPEEPKDAAGELAFGPTTSRPAKATGHAGPLGDREGGRDTGQAQPGLDPVESDQPVGEPVDPPVGEEPPTEPPAGETEQPTEQPDPEPAGPTQGGGDAGQPVEPVEPVEQPTAEPVEEPAEPAEPAEPVEPAPASLAYDDAVLYCTDEAGLVDDPAVADDEFDLCVVELADPATLPADGEAGGETPAGTEATALRKEARPEG